MQDGVNLLPAAWYISFVCVFDRHFSMNISSTIFNGVFLAVKFCSVAGFHKWLWECRRRWDVVSLIDMHILIVQKNHKSVWRYFTYKSDVLHHEIIFRRNLCLSRNVCLFHLMLSTCHLLNDLWMGHSTLHLHNFMPSHHWFKPSTHTNAN